MVITVPTAFTLIAYADSMDVSLIGLALTYLLTLPYFLQQTAFIINTWLSILTSLERILQYKSAQFPQEAPWHKDSDTQDGLIWPSKGEISFEAVTFRYRPSLPVALDSLSLVLSGGKKHGVVGRTGAGKSSLMAVLFRLVELDPDSGGCVKIDGRDISSLGLHSVRQVMRIIPQQPLLMNGTVRDNLDPFNQREDHELCTALTQVGLPASSLDTEIGSGASSLSAGERQLLAVARVMVSGVNIIAMDEPTSSIDSKTDEHLQRVVRKRFSDKTVITIAHRIQSN